MSSLACDEADDEDTAGGSAWSAPPHVFKRWGGSVLTLLRVCLCGCGPGRLVSFVFDGGCAAEAGVDAAAVVEVVDPGGAPGVDLVAGGEGAPVVVLGCECGPQGLSLSIFLCMGVRGRGDSVGVGGGELGEGLFPVGGGASLDEAGGGCSFVGGFASVCEALGGSFVFDVANSQPQEFDGGFFAGEMPAVLGDFTQLVVQRFDSVGGVHDTAQHGRKRQERRKAALQS